MLTRRLFTLRSLALAAAGLFGVRSAAKAATVPAVPTKPIEIQCPGRGKANHRAFLVAWEDRYTFANGYLFGGVPMKVTEDGPVYAESASISSVGPRYTHAIVEIEASPVKWTA